MSKSQDNIYLNITIPAKPDTSANPFPRSKQAIYDETLDIPVLNNPCDYYASIIRFSVPTNALPIFAFPLDIHQNNPNVGTMMIGIINAGGTQFPQTVIYVPSNTIIPPTPGGSDPFFTYGDTTSSYYYIFNVQHFIDMVNTALAAAVTASGIGAPAPFYVYTAATQLMSIIVTQAFLATNAKIFMNYNLKPYFNSFRFDANSTGVLSNYFTHNFNTLPYGSPVGGPYQFDEEHSSLALWFDMRKIIVTTSLPIAQEASPSINNSSTGTSSYLPIFTDFAVSYNNLNEFATVVNYNPVPQYRLADMSSTAPINRISLTFYWLSKNGSLNPVYISPGQNINLKIGFFKKNLYKHESH